MTYLQLVNKVLVRLRETTVTTVNENAYSALVGEFVNDAKRMVEDAWDWSHFRTVISEAVDAGESSVEFTFLSDRSRINNVYNSTDKVKLQYKTREWFYDNDYLNSDVSGVPQYYTIKNITGQDSVQFPYSTVLLLYPTPDKRTFLVVDSTLKTAELESDASVVYVPYAPIVDLAVAFAARERGETGGTSAQELFAIADKSLADAIAFDANRHPEELIYQVV